MQIDIHLDNESEKAKCKEQRQINKGNWSWDTAATGRRRAWRKALVKFVKFRGIVKGVKYLVLIALVQMAAVTGNLHSFRRGEEVCWIIRIDR